MKKKTTKNDVHVSLFDLATQKNSAEVQDSMEFYFSAKKLIESEDIKNKDLMFCVPPKTVLYDFLEAFKAGTDFPLEIPFFVLFHYISAFLLDKKVKYTFSGREHEVDLWSIILAESSAGKTTTSTEIQEVVGSVTTSRIEHTLGTGSAAVLKEDLRKHNRKLFFKDEFGQFFAMMKTQPYMQEIKDILLRVYDHSTIEYKTKKESFEIENPAISFIGVNTPDSFIDKISTEDMLDGFMQRFSVIFADWDPNRPVESRKHFTALYDLLPKTKDNFFDMLSKISIEKYIFSDSATEEYDKAFDVIVAEGKGLPRSFIRRIMYRLTKYAVLYHVLLGKGNIETIDKEDIIYASRVTFILIKNNIRLLELHDKDNDLTKVIDAVKKVYDKMVERKGKCTASDIIQNVRYFRNKSSAQVKSFMSLLELYNSDIKI